jgi:hypothetical protein
MLLCLSTSPLRVVAPREGVCALGPAPPPAEADGGNDAKTTPVAAEVIV